ncbi:MAG: Crp/Fnr family transcriptional regulator [Aromatoleum sp.]|nr:Crp/Fnr family transcriptional regulator [Aromatoleum sp.]
MSNHDRQHFLDLCDEVDLALSEVLCEPGERIRHAYFPIDGVISLVAPVDGPGRLEVGLVGHEGMFGTPLVLGVETSPLQALVQGPGASLRMDADLFRRELARSRELQGTLDRYLCVRMAQLARAVACTRFHVVEARLARLLLAAQDRARSRALHVTHEFLAVMLGVRRVGVTKAASALQKRRLIRYTRGDITILDRPGLQSASCECYQVDRDTYARIMSDNPQRPRSRVADVHSAIPT